MPLQIREGMERKRSMMLGNKIIVIIPNSSARVSQDGWGAAVAWASVQMLLELPSKLEEANLCIVLIVNNSQSFHSRTRFLP
jgi:hypothetical protein